MDIFNSLALVVDVLKIIVICCSWLDNDWFRFGATNLDLLSVLIVGEMFWFEYFPFFVLYTEKKNKTEKKKKRQTWTKRQKCS